MQPTPPSELWTKRLHLRAVEAGDGAMINRAVDASHAALSLWMPWARTRVSVAETETFARESAARFRTREELNYCVFLSRSQGDTYIGQVGLHHIDWAVPCFEIGYWLHSAFTGHGYMTEAVRALVDLCFGTFQAQRIEIRCDERNRASAGVALRAGFALEARMPRKARANDGSLATILLYARLRPDE